MDTSLDRIILLIIVCLFSQYIAEAKTDTVFFGRNELCFGSGIWSSVQLLQGVKGGERGWDLTPINTYSGTFSITYRRYVTQRVALTAALAYENEAGEWRELAYGVNSDNSIRLGSFNRNVYTIAPEVLFYYTDPKRSAVALYGYCGIGYTYQNEVGTYDWSLYYSMFHNGIAKGELQQSNDRFNFNWQICPIGVTVGRRIKFYFETGFGYKGALTAGVSSKI